MGIGTKNESGWRVKLIMFLKLKYMIKFTEYEINELFRAIDEYDRLFKKNKYVKISLETIADFADDDEVSEILKLLVGYEVKIKVDGDHRHDGQMVDYGLYFKNPEGKVTEVWTEMCLMCGWNHCQDEEIQ